jgi:uncharacterized protein YggE
MEERMKKMRNGIGGIVCVLIAALAAQAQQIQVNKDNRTIAITATDKATAEAETATVHIGFQLFAPDSDTAYANGSRVSNAIVSALKQSGIPDKAIQSESQGLHPNNFFNDKDSAQDRLKKQFVLEQNWTVETSAKDAPNALHLAVQAGANNSGAIDWNVADRKELQAQAAANALTRAQVIAAQMAKGLGVKVIGLIYASNQTPEQPGPRPLQLFAKLQAPPPVQPLAIEPRRIEEDATVYAVFAIE